MDDEKQNGMKDTVARYPAARCGIIEHYEQVTTITWHSPYNAKGRKVQSAPRTCLVDNSSGIFHADSRESSADSMAPHTPTAITLKYSLRALGVPSDKLLYDSGRSSKYAYYALVPTPYISADYGSTV